MGNKPTRTAEAVIQSQKDEIFALLKQNKSLENTLRLLDDRITQLEKDHAEHLDKLSEAMAAKNTLIESQDKRIKNLLKQIDEIQADNVGYMVRIKEYESKEDINMDVVSREMADKLQAEANAAIKQLDETKDLIDSLRGELQDKKMSIDRLDKMNHIINNNYINLQGEMEELKKHATTHQVSIGAMAQLVNKLPQNQQ